MGGLMTELDGLELYRVQVGDMGYADLTRRVVSEGTFSEHTPAGVTTLTVPDGDVRHLVAALGRIRESVHYRTSGFRPVADRTGQWSVERGEGGAVRITGPFAYLGGVSMSIEYENVPDLAALLHDELAARGRGR